MGPHLMKEHVVSEIRVTIQLRVAAVRSPASLGVPSKDMYQPMLNLLRHSREVHVVAATRRALDLSHELSAKLTRK
jgi:hypothetical protein